LGLSNSEVLSRWRRRFGFDLPETQVGGSIPDGNFAAGAEWRCWMDSALTADGAHDEMRILLIDDFCESGAALWRTVE